MVTPFCKSDELKTIITCHDLKKTVALPLILRVTNIEGVPFRRIKSWPEDTLDAIAGKSWHDEDEAFYYLQEHLKRLVSEIKIQKEEIENAWQEALKKNAKKEYGKFLKNFRHTKYGPEARKKLEALEEADLWKKAEERNDIETYLAYIRDAPLKNNKSVAIQRIHAIEEDEEKIWADANENNQIGLLLAYRKRFVTGKYRAQSKALFEKIVDNNLGFRDRPNSLEMKSFGLHYYANQHLRTPENFLYDYTVDYTRYIQQLLKIEEANAKSLGSAYKKNAGSWLIFSILIFFLGYGIKLLFKDISATINFYPMLMKVILLITALIIPLYYLFLNRIYSIYTILFKDISTNCALYSVQLKIALALDKEFQLNLIFKNFVDIENLILNKNYNKWSHLFGFFLAEKPLKKIVRYFSEGEIYWELFHPHWPLFKSEPSDYLLRNITLNLNEKQYESPSPSFTL
ncbi:MAG: hypothetical protein R2828_10910 [Saprospiraceae bacterium]